MGRRFGKQIRWNLVPDTFGSEEQAILLSQPILRLSCVCISHRPIFQWSIPSPLASTGFGTRPIWHVSTVQNRRICCAWSVSDSRMFADKQPLPWSDDSDIWKLEETQFRWRGMGRDLCNTFKHVRSGTGNQGRTSCASLPTFQNTFPLRIHNVRQLRRTRGNENRHATCGFYYWSAIGGVPSRRSTGSRAGVELRRTFKLGVHPSKELGLARFCPSDLYIFLVQFLQIERGDQYVQRNL